MNEYNRLLLNDLKIIDSLIEKSTNKEEIKLLNYDKKNLLYETGKLNSLDKMSKYSFDFKPDEFNKIIINNNINGLYLPTIFSLKHSNSYNNKTILKEFFNEDRFKLVDVYNTLNSYNGIVYVQRGRIENANILGKTIHIKTLKKSYIEFKFNNKIIDYSVLIHELGHAKQNFMRDTVNKQFKKSIFSEAYPVFLELEFLEYIKKFGLEKESYNLKKDQLLAPLRTIDILYDQLDKYKNMSENQKEIFYYSLSLVLGFLLATYFFNMYNKDPIQCLKQLKIFLNNYGTMDDKSLLSSIGLSITDFSNANILIEYIKNLKSERIKIKKKI